MISGLDNTIFIRTMELLSHSNAATTLLVHPLTSTVRLNVGAIPKDAHGMAESYNSILVNEHTLDTPVILGIVIIHELTHCLDFCDVGAALRTGSKTWATELNAHMNQGLVLRELNETLPESHNLRDALSQTYNSNTTFGLSAEWLTRKQCAKAIKGRYADALGRDSVTDNYNHQRWVKAANLHSFPENIKTTLY